MDDRYRVVAWQVDELAKEALQAQQLGHERDAAVGRAGSLQASLASKEAALRDARNSIDELNR